MIFGGGSSTTYKSFPSHFTVQAGPEILAAVDIGH